MRRTIKSALPNVGWVGGKKAENKAQQEETTMRSLRNLAVTSLAVLTVNAAWADDDIWKRPTLLDAPGGLKQELA